MSTKRKLPQKLAQPKATQNAKIVSKSNLDDSRTVVSGNTNAIKSRLNGVKEIVDISSDSGSEEEDNSEEESADEAQPTNGEDISMGDADSPAPIPEDAEENGEQPSFGDLVRANASEPIDVAGAFEDPSRTLAYPQGNQIQPPSGASLGTVLTQALKTNDVSLLESCLHTSDVNTIRATIQRLDSPLAGTLLQKLAERLHRRPGRAGSLMVWVQWTLVSHGGYLATQKDLIKKLAELNRVIDERAKGLQSLLSLKGKLDMLEAQIELRRNMQSQRRRVDEDEEDEGVIYVEGEESDDEGVAKPQRLARNGDLEDISGGSEASGDMPMTNGIIADSEDSEDDSDQENLIDAEAEETDDDSADEDEVDHDDEDSEEESDEEPPPTKLQRVSGVSSKRR